MRVLELKELGVLIHIQSIEQGRGLREKRAHYSIKERVLLYRGGGVAIELSMSWVVILHLVFDVSLCPCHWLTINNLLLLLTCRQDCDNHDRQVVKLSKGGNKMSKRWIIITALWFMLAGACMAGALIAERIEAQERAQYQFELGCDQAEGVQE